MGFRGGGTLSVGGVGVGHKGHVGVQERLGWGGVRHREGILHYRQGPSDI